MLKICELCQGYILYCKLHGAAYCLDCHQYEEGPVGFKKLFVRHTTNNCSGTVRWYSVCLCSLRGHRKLITCETKAESEGRTKTEPHIQGETRQALRLYLAKKGLYIFADGTKD